MTHDTTPDRILFVDDEQAILDALVRQHRKHYSIVTACGSEAGLRTLVQEGPFTVVVTDFQMPGMNGTEFLAKARELAPETIRVMLTGQADLKSAIDAVNRGRIFRFLTKPCEPETLRTCLDAALEQHHLHNAERLLLEQTVRGSIEVLADVLALANPAAFGRALRIRDYVKHVVAHLKLRDAWQYETAALLSQIGYIAVPNAVIEQMMSGQPLSPDQLAMLDQHPDFARDLIRKIPRLQPVADIVQRQRLGEAHYVQSDDQGIAIGGRILTAVTAFEELLSLGASASDALEALRGDYAKYDPHVLDALATIQVVADRGAIHTLPISQLQAGMVLEEDIRNADDQLVVMRGHQITQGSLQRLHNYAALKLLAKSEFNVRFAESGSHVPELSTT